jgi:hypothetical protein
MVPGLGREPQRKPMRPCTLSPGGTAHSSQANKPWGYARMETDKLGKGDREGPPVLPRHPANH